MWLFCEANKRAVALLLLCVLMSAKYLLKELNYLYMAVICSLYNCCETLTSFTLDISSVLTENFYHVKLILLSSEEEGARSFGGLGIDIRAMVK